MKIKMSPTIGNIRIHAKNCETRPYKYMQNKKNSDLVLCIKQDKLSPAEIENVLSFIFCFLF